MDSILPRHSTSAKKHASMGAWDKTDLLPRSHSVWIKNIRIEVQEALDGSSKAPCDTHERVVGLELVHCTNVQQLPVFDAIEHPCGLYGQHVQTLWLEQQSWRKERVCAWQSMATDDER